MSVASRRHSSSSSINVKDCPNILLERTTTTPRRTMKTSFTSSSININKNWIVIIPLLCTIVLNIRNLRLLRKISVNYVRRVALLTASSAASLRKAEVIPSNTCLTTDECDHARQQIGLEEFEIGNFSEYGCFRKGMVAYWGRPSTSLHMKEMYAALDDKSSNRIHCNHKRPQNTSPWPGVSWLMSFPNSGTSYTGALVRSSSSTATATNYGSSNTFNRMSKQLFDWSTVGPFMTDPKSSINGKLDISKNGTYVLTKTHCGGYCFGCHPKQYVQTQTEFRNDCLTGDFLDEFGGKQKTMYDASIVDKAVHLVRDPFDNVVSRFHLKRNQKQGNATWLAAYPNSIEGFRNFCAYVNTRLHSAEENFPVVGAKSNANVLVKYREKIPCYSDFVRYVLWHNHAIETIDELGLDHLTLHYEDYGSNHRETTVELFQFLGLSLESKGEEFHGSERYYRDYFTTDDIQAVQELLRDIASNENWNLLRRYFD
mmetsp:Transcript_25402/g.43133  ORF Transcript_25402/g.43133 Transcript_25402/m.43133 type:complete len:485 (-) Transcript_25402:84-1538(-)